jgi:hypothetical protein
VAFRLSGAQHTASDGNSGHSAFGRLKGVGSLLLLLGCSEDVSLGSWGKVSQPSASSPGAAGTASETPSPAMSVPVGPGPVSAPAPQVSETPPAPSATVSALGSAGLELPLCNMPAAPGGLTLPVPDNMWGTQISTDWNLPRAASELEWDLVIEKDSPARDEVTQVPFSGYYWKQEFNFDSSAAVIVGFQSEGVYKDVPSAADKEYTKMAVFWISGSNIEAKLGDIKEPNARAVEQQADKLYMTIHVKFDWQLCHVYHFRFAPQLVEAAIWYGVWIDDRTTGETVFLGRMRLPEEAGMIRPSVTSTTQAIRHNPPRCALIEPVSAFFGVPTMNAGDSALDPRTRAITPLGCARSRWTTLTSAVRHEVGIVP